MSQLANIQSAQKRLEERFMKKMDDLEAQIQGASSQKDTVAKVAEEFRSFRDTVFDMLGLIREQISECSRQIDNMESRSRRKSLIFSGIKEDENDDCQDKILNILNNKLALKSITKGSIKVCHRLGAVKKDRPRPILVKFVDAGHKSAVWKAKTALKGSSITIKEFLTKSRQLVFNQARSHFGMRECWTQDGVIVIKSSDDKRHKICSLEELNTLVKQTKKTGEQDAAKGKPAKNS